MQNEDKTKADFEIQTVGTKKFWKTEEEMKRPTTFIGIGGKKLSLILRT
jgi:hypothetical protein